MYLRIKFFLVCSLLIMPNIGNAQVDTKWVVNPMMEDFSDPNNWTLGLPDVNDTATFDTGSPFKVVMDVDASVDKIAHLSGALTLLGPKSLNVVTKIELDTEFNVGQECILRGESSLILGVLDNANMTVSNMSELEFDNEIVVGNSTNLTGELIMLDSIASADRVVVGANGEGYFAPRTGSVVTSNDLTVGFGENSIGLVDLDFNFARIITDDAIIGSRGRGDVELGNGTQLTANASLVCGDELGGEGAILIVGNSSLEADSITLGFEGDGAILMGDGMVNCGTVDIGVQPGSMGGIGVAENGVFNCSELNAGIAGGCQLLIRESGSILVSQTATLNDDSVICFQDSPDFGLLSCFEGLVAEGLIKFVSGTGRIVGDVTLQGDGEIEATEGRGEIIGDVTHNGDEIYIDAQTEFVIDGDYQGSGSFDGGGDVTFMGALTPGPGPQVADLDVQVTLSSSSDLKIQIGGTEIGEFDRINVGGNLNLQGGELSVVMTDGFVPQPGDSFTIAVSDANISGTFDGLSPNSIFTSDDGFEFQIIYNTTADFIRIVAQGPDVLLGDVNMDGEVNLLDVGPFVAALTAGTFILEADTNQDGNVDLLDVGPFVDILTN